MKISAKYLESLSPEDRIKALLAERDDNKRLTSLFVEEQCKLDSVTVSSPTAAKVVFSFTVHNFYCNASGGLHGGAQSMIHDILSTLAVMAIGKDGGWLNGGVSRVLTVNYLRPAQEGVEMELEAEVVGVGKTLCLLRSVMRRKHDGVAVSTCEHSKVAVANKPSWKL